MSCAETGRTMGTAEPHISCPCGTEPSFQAASPWNLVGHWGAHPASPGCCPLTNPAQQSPWRGTDVPPHICAPSLSRRALLLFRYFPLCIRIQPSGRTPKKWTQGTSWMRRESSGSARPSWHSQQVSAAPPCQLRAQECQLRRPVAPQCHPHHGLSAHPPVLSFPTGITPSLCTQGSGCAQARLWPASSSSFSSPRCCRASPSSWPRSTRRWICSPYGSR